MSDTTEAEKLICSRLHKNFYMPCFNKVEIKAIHKSQLTKAERKKVKDELKNLNKEAKLFRGGIYLSVGAIIIIILLLIIIF